MSYLKRRLMLIYGNHMMKKYAGLAQQSVEAGGVAEPMDPEISKTARMAASQGCVLLQNNGVLPLNKEKPVAIFGRCQLDWFYVGYGSGGDVNPPYRVNLIDGMNNAGASYDHELLDSYENWRTKERNKADDGFWGHWPMNYPEMHISGITAKNAALRQKNVEKTTALIVIGRAAGEDRENKLIRGSYYLTHAEEQMIKNVTSAFDETVVVMDIGNIMDFSWVKKYKKKISALLICWQGGMESGNALCDVLYGNVNPSGRLPATILYDYKDYPSADNFGGKDFNEYKEDIFVGYRGFNSENKEKIQFPFGYGLSYTSFAIEKIETTLNGKPELIMDQLRYSESGSHRLKVCALVTNTGNFDGKEVIQLWCRQPEGKIKKPQIVLAGFSKADILEPGEKQQICVETDLKYLASYDETRSAFVLEKGKYEFYLSDCSYPEAFNNPCAVIQIMEEVVTRQCEKICISGDDLKGRILSSLPEDIPFTGDKGYILKDVNPDSDEDIRKFLEQFSNEELEALTRGHGMMSSPLGVPGNAGVFGGITQTLRDKGIMPVVTSDGPAGLRLRTFCALMPCGTLQASTFDTWLISELYSCVGREMVKHGVDILLGPGMNIHRNPLCGRNFEYFSEDPLLSGKMAAAVVRGVESQGKAACIKHFVCNNQEVRRNTNDSRVSERALREIYLRNFEICIDESDPKVLMTSYNKVNGVWAHYNYDLVTTVLRKEWGYKGTVITDWWMQSANSSEFPELRDNAYRVRAQVDVLMPGDSSRFVTDYVSDGTLLESIGHKDGITRGEIARSAANVLKLVLYLAK